MWFKIINLNIIKFISKRNIKLHPSVIYFHRNSINNAKLFVEVENDFAHKILEKFPNQKYKLFSAPILNFTVTKNSELELNLNAITIESSINDVYECFKELVYYCNKNQMCISNDLFDEFVDTFTTKCPQFNDLMLVDSIKLMSLLPITPHAHFKNFVELWNGLDDACVLRLENWTTDQILLVCDCLYSLNIARLSQFVWLAIRKFGRKIKKLEPNQLLQSLFYCNVLRKAGDNMFDYEVAFTNVIDKMSIEEIAVMSMAFFKTKTLIRNPDLIETIYKRLIPELDRIEDITLVNILKILRYSCRLPQAELIKELLDKICPQIERLSLLSCLHIALVGCEIQQCHEKSLNLIVDRFLNEVETVRLKDMERICHVISLHNFQTEKTKVLCTNILRLLETKVSEIIRYPQCFPLCLHYLSLCGYYRDDYISAALRPKFVHYAYKRNVLLGREIFCLDSYAKINLNNYTGNQLTDKQRATFGKLLTNYIPERGTKFKISATENILLEIKETCDKIFTINATLKHVLPHFERPDILLCYDKSKKNTIRISENCPENYKGIILTKDLVIDTKNPDLETIVIVIAGWNNYVRDENRPTGLLKMKLNQLNILGHKNILVTWFDWRALETFKDRKNFLQRKLINIL